MESDISCCQTTSLQSKANACQLTVTFVVLDTNWFTPSILSKTASDWLFDKFGDDESTCRVVAKSLIAWVDIFDTFNDKTELITRTKLLTNKKWNVLENKTRELEVKYLQSKHQNSHLSSVLFLLLRNRCKSATRGVFSVAVKSGLNLWMHRNTFGQNKSAQHT